MRNVALSVLLALTGCTTTTYQPEPVRHPMPLPGDAFEIVLGVLRDRYGRLVVSDRATFRLQTGWRHFQRGDSPGRQRATIFREADGRLRVVIEAKYLGIGSDGLPETSGPYGDRRAEERLAGILERALAPL